MIMDFFKDILPNISDDNLIIGKNGIRYPFYLYTSEDQPDFKLDENLFTHRLDKHTFKIPADIDKLRDDLLRNERSRYVRSQRKWYNDTLCRLSRIEVDNRNEEEKVYLHFQKTNYDDHYLTNINLNNHILASGKQTIRDNYARNFIDIIDLGSSKLANPLGVSIFVVNRNTMKGFIGLRSEHVAMHRGYYAIAGGHIQEHKDLEAGKPNPFLAAARETENEFNGSITHRDLKCLGIGTDLILGHPNILFLAKTDLNLHTINRSRRFEKKEFKMFFAIDLTKPKDLFKYLDPIKISPNNAACIILSVEHLLPDIYCRNSVSPREYFSWEKDIFKTNYYIAIQRKSNGKGLLIVNNEHHRAIELTIRQTEVSLLIAKKLMKEGKKKKKDIGYVSLDEFKKNISDWYPDNVKATHKTSDSQVLTQIMKIRDKLKIKGYRHELIETLEGERKARLSTFPDRITITI